MQEHLFRDAVAVLLLVTALVGVNAAAGEGTPEDPLIFGVVPARSPAQQMKRFGPLVQALARDVGMAIRLRGAPDYATFINRALEGTTYDVMLSGGDVFQFLRRRSAPVPVARMKAKGVFAVIAVRRGSPLKSLADLKAGGTVATADPLAYSTGLGLRALRKAGVDPDRDIQLMIVPSQSSSLQSLVRSQVDAALIMIPVYRSAPPAVRTQLRVLAETERAPPPVVSTTTHLAPAKVQRIKRFLLNLDTTPAGKKLLIELGWPGFASVDVNEYDSLDWAVKTIEGRLRVSD